MGKDKKEKNPADAFRKEQRKKELLKLKKDREVVREVRDLLNDPKKIDEEIAKAQKISDENKLDKSLKDRIKELQRMKDVANTRQLVLAAQGKKSMAEAESITKPSIYQNNTGVWDDPSAAKSAPGAHPHVKSASRVSTEGLPTYSRGGDVPLASQMPLPTSVMLPYPPALVPNVFPRGPVMGGMGGIPLPPPRPSGPGAPYGAQMPPHMMNPAMAGHMLPPPPPRGPPGSQPPMTHVLPPPHMYGMPMQGYPPGCGGPGMVQGYQQPGQYGGPPQQPYGRGAPRSWQPPAQRKPRPVKHQQEEEVDPLDPAGHGYTERFGSGNPAKRLPQMQAPKPPATDSAEGSNLMPQDSTVSHSGSVAPPPPPSPVVHRADNVSAAAVSHASLATAPPPPPPPMAATHSFGPVLSAEDLMRRRMQVSSHEAAESAEGTTSSSSAPPPGPTMNFGTVLSTEELMRRRHQVSSQAVQDLDSDALNGPSVGPALPPPGPSLPSYGTTLTAEELMRRRYQIPDEVEDEHDSDPQVEDDAQAVVDHTPSARPAQHNYSAALSAEELMRRRYEIPDVVVEDVDSDNDESDIEGPRGYQYGDGDAEEDQTGDVSEDEVRSAGMADTADFDDSEFPYPQDDDEDLPGGALELNVNNLYPARLPATFTALPQPVRPQPSVVPAYPAPKASYSAISFNDYGDEDDDEQENEENYYEEPVPKILPYAQPSITAAVLPSCSTPALSTTSDSYAPQACPHSDISRTVVKGPKIVKTDRALTAFVPNALKKKRLLSSTTAGSAPWQSVKVAKVSASEPDDVQAENSDEDQRDTDERYRQTAAVRSAEDLHAATNALLRGASANSATSTAAPVIRTGYVASRSTVAPIAFVTASTNNSATAGRAAPSVPAPVPSVEEDAMAQFFQELNQL